MGIIRAYKNYFKSVGDCYEISKNMTPEELDIASREARSAFKHNFKEYCLKPMVGDIMIGIPLSLTVLGMLIGASYFFDIKDKEGYLLPPTPKNIKKLIEQRENLRLETLPILQLDINGDGIADKIILIEKGKAKLDSLEKKF